MSGDGSLQHWRARAKINNNVLQSIWNPHLTAAHMAGCCTISVCWLQVGYSRHISRPWERPRLKAMPRNPLMAFRLQFPRGWRADRDRAPLFSTSLSEARTPLLSDMGSRAQKSHLKWHLTAPSRPCCSLPPHCCILERFQANGKMISYGTIRGGEDWVEIYLAV